MCSPMQRVNRELWVGSFHLFFLPFVPFLGLSCNESSNNAISRQTFPYRVSPPLTNLTYCSFSRALLAYQTQLFSICCCAWNVFPIISGEGLRVPASWPPLTAGASSRNLYPQYYGENVRYAGAC